MTEVRLEESPVGREVSVAALSPILEKIPGLKGSPGCKKA